MAKTKILRRYIFALVFPNSVVFRIACQLISKESLPQQSLKVIINSQACDPVWLISLKLPTKRLLKS